MDFIPGIEKLYFESIDSTNNYAINLARNEAAKNGTVIWTNFQTAGKGQRGNFWESAKGKNLTFSVIYYPKNLHASKQFEISKFVTLAISQSLKKYYQDIRIKWPNDIYAGNKKIAGILIENTLSQANILFSVIGIGLNLNQTIFESNAPNPVSLATLTGREYDRSEFLSEICTEINKAELLFNQQPEELNTKYLSELFGYQQWMKFRSEDNEFEGLIKGVNEFGFLQVRNKQGMLDEYAFKEISLVL